jgi:hypothetical protein
MTRTQPADLLRRFVPTPYYSVVETSGGPVGIHSNDGAFSYHRKPEAASDTATIKCVLIRDDSVPTRPQTLLLEQGEILTVLVAEGAHLHLDKARQEILGFAHNSLDTLVILYWIERLLTHGATSHE